MNEAEIEQTIKDNLDFVPGEEPATVYLSFAKAAHAIAENLREGVAWEGEALSRTIGEDIVVVLLPRVARSHNGTELRASHAGPGPSCELWRKRWGGQLVTVTVSKKEEGDGQGVG